MVVCTGAAGERVVVGAAVCKRNKGEVNYRAGVAEDTLSASTQGRVPVARQAELHIRGSRPSLQSVPVP